jgi:hypothetical protein
MAKIKINKLPQGFSIRNGKVVEDAMSMEHGGMVTGDQSNYGLVTTPQAYYGDTNFNNSRDESVRYSLSSVPREDANLEAEGGETVLTDLNDDGTLVCMTYKDQDTVVEVYQCFCQNNLLFFLTQENLSLQKMK